MHIILHAWCNMCFGWELHLTDLIYFIALLKIYVVVFILFFGMVIISFNLFTCTHWVPKYLIFRDKLYKPNISNVPWLEQYFVQMFCLNTALQPTFVVSTIECKYSFAVLVILTNTEFLHFVAVQRPMKDSCVWLRCLSTNSPKNSWTTV